MTLFVFVRLFFSTNYNFTFPLWLFFSYNSTLLWPPNYLLSLCNLNIQILCIIARRSSTNLKYWRLTIIIQDRVIFVFAASLKSFFLLMEEQGYSKAISHVIRSNVNFNFITSCTKSSLLLVLPFICQNNWCCSLTLLPIAMIRCLGSSELPKQWGHFSMHAARRWCSRIAWFLSLSFTFPLSSLFAALETNMSSRV